MHLCVAVALWFREKIVAMISVSMSHFQIKVVAVSNALNRIVTVQVSDTTMLNRITEAGQQKNSHFILTE